MGRLCQLSRRYPLAEQARRLGASPAHFSPPRAATPYCSPDGITLAFSSSDNFHSESMFVQLFDIKNRQLSRIPSAESVFAPRWSPAGRSIVVINLDNSHLLLLDVKTQKLHTLATGLGLIGYLAWSADSSSVYFDTVQTQNPGYYMDRPWPESNSSLCTRPQRPGNLRPRRGPPVISALPRQECRHRTGCCVRSSADGTTPCPRLRASSTGAAMMARTRSRNVGTSSLVNPLVSMASCR